MRRPAIILRRGLSEIGRPAACREWERCPRHVRPPGADLHGPRGLLVLILAYSSITPVVRAGGSDAAEDRAVSEIRDEGGEVERDDTRPDRPVVRIRLGGLRVDDGTLARLRAFPRLRELSFSSYSVSDDGLGHLGDLTDLEVLRFRSNSVRGPGLATWPGSRGCIRWSAPATGSLRPLSHPWRRLTGLRELSIGGPSGSDAEVAKLKALSGLRTLALHHCLADAGLASLGEMTHLRDLTVSSNHITDAGLKHLAGLTGLERLGLLNAPLTGAGLEHLKGMARLEKLEFHSYGLTDAGLVHLPPLAPAPGAKLRALFQQRACQRQRPGAPGPLDRAPEPGPRPDPVLRRRPGPPGGIDRVAGAALLQPQADRRRPGPPGGDDRPPVALPGEHAVYRRRAGPPARPDPAARA